MVGMNHISALDHMWEQRTRRDIQQRCQLELQRSQSMAAGTTDLEEHEWRPIYQTRDKETAEISSQIQKIVVSSWDISDSLTFIRRLTQVDFELLDFYKLCMKNSVGGKKVVVLGHGGGGGILSIIAAAYNASSVTLIESNRIGFELSRELLDNNKALKFSQNITLSQQDSLDQIDLDAVVIVDSAQDFASSLQSYRALKALILKAGSSSVVIPSHHSINSALLCINNQHLPGFKLSEALRDLTWSPGTGVEAVDLTRTLPIPLLLSDPFTIGDISIADGSSLGSSDELKKCFEVPLNRSGLHITHAASWMEMRFETHAYSGRQRASRLHHQDSMTGQSKAFKAFIYSEHQDCHLMLRLIGASDLQESISVNSNLRSPRFLSIPSWGEMDKVEKSTSYAKAVTRAVMSSRDKGSISPHVLCVGSQNSCGSTVCYAAQAGARVTYRSQTNESLLSRLTAFNGIQSKISFVKSLNDPSISPVDIVVLESFDVGLLGEGCLIHLARAHDAGLISAETVVLPDRAVVWAVLASINQLDCRDGQDQVIDLSSMNAIGRLTAAEGYSALDLKSDKNTIHFLSEPVMMLDSIVFKASKNDLLASGEKTLVLKATRAGEVNAVISWFSTYLSDDTMLFSSGPNCDCMDVAAHWGTTRSVTDGEEVAVVARRDPDGISIKITSLDPPNSLDPPQADEKPLHAYIKKMKRIHQTMIVSLGQTAFMDPIETRQLANLANKLSSSSPAAAKYLSMVMSAT